VIVTDTELKEIVRQENRFAVLNTKREARTGFCSLRGSTRAAASTLYGRRRMN